MSVLYPFPHYGAFTAYTPTIPKFYWDVYSQEERIKALCMEYCKLIAFTDSMVDTVNSQYELIVDLQEKLPELVNEDVIAEINRLIESGQFQKYVDDAISKLETQYEGVSKKLDELSNAVLRIESEYKAVMTTANAIMQNYGVPYVFNGSLDELNASSTVDKTKAYVTTTNGHWNYWNGSAWVDGGTYNSQGIGREEITAQMLNSGLYKHIETYNYANPIDWANSIRGRAGTDGTSEQFDVHFNMNQDGFTVKAPNTPPIAFRTIFNETYPLGTLLKCTINAIDWGSTENFFFGICDADSSSIATNNNIIAGIYVESSSKKIQAKIKRNGFLGPTHEYNTFQEVDTNQENFELLMYIAPDGEIYIGGTNWIINLRENINSYYPTDSNGNELKFSRFKLFLQMSDAVVSHGFTNVEALQIGWDVSQLAKPNWSMILKYPTLGNAYYCIQFPSNYTPDKNKKFPMVILAHGNGMTFDGRGYNTGFTHIRQYMPTSISDNPPDIWIMTYNVDKWFKTETSYALLNAGYVCVSATYFADLIYGNEDCINSLGALYDYVLKMFNVSEFVYTLGASNGCMTVLNALNLIQGKIRATAMYYPLCCLYNQYYAQPNHQAGINAAYSIPEGATQEEVEKALWQHDPLTTQTMNGIKLANMPAMYISYSPDDATTPASANAIPFIDMLNNSHIINTVKIASGAHGDISHFDPQALVNFFNDHRVC